MTTPHPPDTRPAIRGPWAALPLALLAAACSRAEPEGEARSAIPDLPEPRLSPRAIRSEVELGSVVSDLEFLDRNHLPRRLSELGEASAIVVVFTTRECPLAHRYLPRLAEMERTYRDRGVRFLAVNVGPDSVLEMAAQGLEHDVDFPFGKDMDGTVAEAFGVSRTPEVAVLDPGRRLVYRGRIDDQYRLGGVRPSPSREDLVRALEDVLAGREPEVAETSVEGCLITVSDVLPAPELTWTEHIRPLVRERCATCHRPGDLAPFNLWRYGDVERRAAMVAEVVSQGRMPPWFASPQHGDFDNVGLLSDTERGALLGWLAAGAPRGDGEPDGPPPDAHDWYIGEPDLVLDVPPTDLPADGYVEYVYQLIEPRFAHDTWVEALEVLPSESGVQHHVQVMFVRDGVDTSSAEVWIPAARYLGVYVPGRRFDEFEPGTALVIPKHSRLAVQIHYVTKGRAVTDRPRIGLRFPRVPVEHRVAQYGLQDYDFVIPPHAPSHVVESVTVLKRPKPLDALWLFPHMHLRGKSFEIFATYPDGEEEKLLEVPAWNFDWQFAYTWPPGTRRFPEGTSFRYRARLDNSSFNPYNPDPDRPVPFGQRTEDEMVAFWLAYTNPNEELHVPVDPETGEGLVPFKLPRERGVRE